MFPYALWRKKSIWDNEWEFVRGVSSKNIAHCSTNEIIVSICCNPNNV